MSAQSMLGNLLLDQDRFAEAEPLLQEVADESRGRYGADHPNSLYAKGRLLLAVAQRDPQRAEEGLRQVVDASATQLGDTHWHTWHARTSLATVLNLERKHEEAELVARRAWDDSIRAQNDPNADWRFEAAQDTLAVALLGQQRVTEAEQTACDLVNWIERHPIYHYQSKLPRFRNHWGQCLLELRRYADAEQQFKLAYAGEVAMRGPEHWNTWEVIANLVRLYELWGKPEQAAEWRVKLPATQPAATQP